MIYDFLHPLNVLQRATVLRIDEHVEWLVITGYELIKIIASNRQNKPFILIK